MMLGGNCSATSFVSPFHFAGINVEEQLRAFINVLGHRFEEVAELTEEPLTAGRLQNQQRENKLQAQPPDDDSRIDLLLVGTHQPREKHHREQAEKTNQAFDLHQENSVKHVRQMLTIPTIGTEVLSGES